MIFNVVFNKKSPTDILTFKYWAGQLNTLKQCFLSLSAPVKPNVLDIVMNSYLCVLNYNQIDYQAMMDEEKKKKKYHESTLIRQIVYFLIFFIIFLG